MKKLSNATLIRPGACNVSPSGGIAMILFHTEPDSPVIEISVEGKITDHDLREAIERMRGDLELNGKTRVLERIEHFTGIEPKALWTDIALGVSVARKVNRAAVVADAGWIRASMHLARFFTKAEIKAFHVNELEQARVWINT
jgi:hypothetical protein